MSDIPFIQRTVSLALCILWLLSGAHAEPDALPSWNDGTAKTQIIRFVASVAAPSSRNFVPAEERIAVFDNDGTLWAEQPIYFQFAFANDRVRALAPEHPEWKEKQPFESILSGDLKSLSASREKGIEALLAATHSGITTDAFAKSVTDWMANARHPTLHRPYNQLIYQPMLDLLTYLRANGFKTYIVSGGGVEFMRPWVEKAYGIPPEQVVGSSGVTKFEIRPDGKPELIKEPKVEFVDDGPGKPVGINRFIGRRPIFAFGNSDGDLQMIEWTVAGSGLRFAGLVHHTDAEREFAYDRLSQVGKLAKALDEAQAKGWTIVDMKQDWRTIFPASH